MAVQECWFSIGLFKWQLFRLNGVVFEGAAHLGRCGVCVPKDIMGFRAGVSS